MKDEIVSFEVANLAKEKGYKNGADCYYTKYGKLTGFKYYEWSDDESEDIDAPTQSLLQRWLREEHNIHVCVESGYDLMLGYNRGYNLTINGVNKYNSNDIYETYEKALEAGLLEALKLID